jgi:hypothetical protein
MHAYAYAGMLILAFLFLKAIIWIRRLSPIDEMQMQMQMQMH